MQIAQALFLAVHLEQQLAPAFERLVVAGSVRRRKTNVKDIELVGLARYGPLQSGLFSDQESRQENLSEHQLPDLLAASAWAIGDKNGPRYKQLVNPYHDINCDLFILHDPAEWGVGLTIRTGPADFNQALMAAILRQGRHVTGNRLHGHPKGRRVNKPQECDRGADCRLIIPTATEEAFFEAVGLPLIEPGERSKQRLAGEISRIGHRFYLPHLQTA